MFSSPTGILFLFCLLLFVVVVLFFLLCRISCANLLVDVCFCDCHTKLQRASSCVLACDWSM